MENKYEECLEIKNDRGEIVKRIYFRTSDPSYFNSEEFKEQCDLYRKIFKDGDVKGKGVC